MRIIIIGNIVNIIGNYLFINGIWHFPQLGLNGAAIGTILSRFFMLAAFVWYFYFKKKYAQWLQGFKEAPLKLTQIKQIAQKGTMLGLQMLVEAGAFGFAGIMVGWMGTSGLAAHQIVISLSTLGFMVYQGMGAATTILISQSYGAKMKSTMQQQAKQSALLTVPLSLAIACFFFMLRHYLPNIFTDDAKVIEVSSNLLIVLALFQLTDALQIIYGSAVRAMTDVKIPVLLLLFSYFAISLPVGYAFAFPLNYKEVGIWLAFPIGVSLAYIFLKSRFRYLIRRIN